MIIDFHTHTFPDDISGRVIDSMTRNSRVRAFTDASRPQLLASMERAGIDWSVNLPVHTRPDQVVKINRRLMDCHQEMVEKHLLTFAGMNPDFEDYKAELHWIKEQGLPGIKLHPSYQQIDLDDPRMMNIIAAAAEEGLAVIIHAGIDVGHTDHNYASVPMILKVIEEIHPERFILAHMGGWGVWEEVEKYLCGAPVWMDTAFSLGPVIPNPFVKHLPVRGYNLTDEHFIRLVHKHGADKILFGTDCPWSDQYEYVKRIKTMPLTDEERESIFWKNAIKVLQSKDIPLSVD